MIPFILNSLLLYLKHISKTRYYESDLPTLCLQALLKCVLPNCQSRLWLRVWSSDLSVGCWSLHFRAKVLGFELSVSDLRFRFAGLKYGLGFRIRVQNLELDVTIYIRCLVSGVRFRVLCDVFFVCRV